VGRAPNDGTTADGDGSRPADLGPAGRSGWDRAERCGDGGGAVAWTYVSRRGDGGLPGAAVFGWGLARLRRAQDTRAGLCAPPPDAWAGPAVRPVTTSCPPPRSRTAPGAARPPVRPSPRSCLRSC